MKKNFIVFKQADDLDVFNFINSAKSIEQFCTFLATYFAKVDLQIHEISKPIVRENLSTLEFLDIKQASAYSGLSPKTLRNLKCSGELAGHNRGNKRKGKVYFPRIELDKYIQKGAK